MEIATHFSNLLVTPLPFLAVRDDLPRCLHFVFFATLLSSLCVAGRIAGQDETKPVNVRVIDGTCIFTEKNPRLFLGVKSCKDCHAQMVQMAEGWAFRNEITLWENNDVHVHAFEVLKNKQSEQMGRLLGVSQIHRDKRCLACHVGLPVHQMDSDPTASGLISDAMAADERITSGVSCESCHGPSETNPAFGADIGWGAIHDGGNKRLPAGETELWRFMSKSKKLTKYGYYDVRSPASKAQMCLSCHLGNFEQGKVVTHKMYAAGHPPLPGFELAMFVEQQPRHWRDLAEKKRDLDHAVKAGEKSEFTEFVEHTKEQFNPGHLHQTHEMLVSALVASSEALKLTAALAVDTPPPPLDKPGWPELSQFACYNCHHDLKRPSWRQERCFPLTPGRPELQQWPTALTRVALTVADVTPEEYQAAFRPVLEELDQQPFGDPITLASKARETARWLDGITVRLESRDITRDDTNAVLRAICQVAASSELVDYDSARQLAWAFAIAYDEGSSRSHRAKVGKVRGWFGDETREPNKIEKVLAELNLPRPTGTTEARLLVLDLRQDKGKSDESNREHDAGAAKEEKEPIETNLQPLLSSIAAYDPREFQKRFAELEQLLDKP